MQQIIATEPQLTPDHIARMTREAREELFEILTERRRREGQRSFHALFPAELRTWTGPKTEVLREGEVIHPRHLYAKHMEFFEAGAEYRERCFMAANRVGKTISGGFEDVCHATGLYPDWWRGRRFRTATTGWIAGKTNESTRDIIQRKIFGQPTFERGVKTMTGTGLMPGDLILACTWKSGVTDLLDTARIRHVTGETSTIGLKAYKQGRGSFEGEEKDWIHLDEEPPHDIYEECLFRTATTKGLVYLTFTPLEGYSSVVRSFLPGEGLNA